ncbi:two-component system nitrogen regulation sensor histidine kinase NtrY [Sphingomonas sp. UYAg733]
MGFDRRFTLVLAGWIVGLIVALIALQLAFQTPGLAVVRILAVAIVAAMVWGLWRHVERTNMLIARFVEALRFGDVTARFDGRGGAGFATLGSALDDAMRKLHTARDEGVQELRFLEALVDDVPVALLTVDDAHGVRLVNKAARRLFDHDQGTRPEDFARYGATFAARLARTGNAGQELLILRLTAGPQRAIVRTGALDRLGLQVRAVTVEPVQGTLDAVEMAAQTDLVRVLTHEILNSLTPVTSLAGTAAAVLDTDPPDIDSARTAMTTLVRRAEGLRHFIDSYRAVAKPPEVKPRAFGAEPFAHELDRLFAADWPQVALTIEVAPNLILEADPDLLAQALINLLRNAAQATSEAGRDGEVRMTIAKRADGGVLMEVADNGPGVPEAVRKDVFLPFFTTRAAGTGVGLNLVRQIVIAHGGSIDLVDTDEGAVFRILL